MPLNSHATFTVESAVELAVVERSGFVESRHIGSAVLLAGDGSVVTELGDITTPIYARSTLKPLQALASMQAGVPLRGAQAAIACGSHVGSLDHMDVVEGMLKAAGVKEEQLQCPAAWPEDETARTWLVRTERGQSKLAFNCSGKHAAFLWACTENGWDTHSYLEPNHPLQHTTRNNRLVRMQFAHEFLAGREEQALSGLCRDLAGWRRIAGDSDTLIGSLFGLGAVRSDSMLLAEMIAEAHIVQARRRPTKPSRSAKASASSLPVSTIIRNAWPRR